MKPSKSNPTDSYQPIGWESAAIVLFTAALWGGTPVAISISVTSLGPIAVSGIRFAMAAVFMLGWALWERTSLKMRPGQFLPCLLGGIVLFFQITCFTAGIKYANASHGTVLINTFVFWVILFECLILRRLNLSLFQLIGLLLASGGAALVVLPGVLNMDQEYTREMLFGDVLLLISALILGGKILYTKWATTRVEPTKFIFWHDVFGVVLFTVASLAFESNSLQDMTLPAAAGLAYQGIFVAGLCFILQANLLKKHSASQISVFSFATPLFGLLFAGLILHEKLTSWLAVSGVCVALGIMLVNRPSRASRSQQ